MIKAKDFLSDEQIEVIAKAIQNQIYKFTPDETIKLIEEEINKKRSSADFDFYINNTLPKNGIFNTNRDIDWIYSEIGDISRQIENLESSRAILLEQLAAVNRFDELNINEDITKMAKARQNEFANIKYDDEYFLVERYDSYKRSYVSVYTVQQEIDNPWNQNRKNAFSLLWRERGTLTEVLKAFNDIRVQEGKQPITKVKVDNYFKTKKLAANFTIIE